VGDLFLEGTTVVLSDLVLSESLWALTRLAYCDAFGHTSYDVEFKTATYRRHHAKIFGGAHGPKVAAVVDFVRDLERLNMLVVSHPANAEWVDQVDRTHGWMRSDRLMPADATHLAIAEKHARTLVTADEAFAKTGGVSPAKLTIVWLRPAVTAPTPPASAVRQSSRSARKDKKHRSSRRGPRR
jgi:predicted nucleic acid-binding protein